MKESIQSNKQIFSDMLSQLGGRKFVVMTGSKNFMSADITEANKNAWLRMDLSRNKSGANRLKIILNYDDTYTMYFYKQQIKNFVDCVITHEKKYEGIYADMLQEIFTQHTGLYTYL